MFLEDEEKPGMDTLLNEFEASCSLIGSSIIEQLFLRFPDISLALYFSLLNDIMTGTLQLSDALADKIFSQLTYLKNVYDHWRTPEDKQVNLEFIFQYLFKKGENSLIHKRRSLIILNKLISGRKIATSPEMFVMLNNLLHVNDFVVQFEVMRCLFLFIKNDHDQQLDFKPLLMNVIPVFVGILKRISNYNLLFQINNQFCNLLERSQDCLGEFIR